MFVIRSKNTRIRVHIGRGPHPRRGLLNKVIPAFQIDTRSSIDESSVPIRTPKSLEKRKARPTPNTPILSQKARQFLMVVKR